MVGEEGCGQFKIAAWTYPPTTCHRGAIGELPLSTEGPTWMLCDDLGAGRLQEGGDMYTCS